MNPTFFTLGRTITHSDLFRRLIGTPFEPLVKSFITSPAACTRSTSLEPSSAAVARVGNSVPATKGTDKH